MELPTPPATGHRDKENRDFSPSSRVVWSVSNDYHTVIDDQAPRLPLTVRKHEPKSILKKTNYIPLPLIEPEERESTPEPADPLSDPTYLEYPVSQILSPDSSLRDLTQAYSVLMARMKQALVGVKNHDASWPLFRPIRKHTKSIVDAIIRDLGRAMVDPETNPVDLEEEFFLPSPKLSPKLKKGMSAEQAKYARDLSTTCHSVMKVLGLIFILPPIYHLFSDAQLSTMLTQVLAIPLSPDLPTPNARKTFALAIWLLQVQRLPDSILVLAKDRIAYALRRGIEGELGKEGKKGATGDGLKAIHDLCIYRPSIFVPTFIELLPSIFANLIGPVLAMRVHACYALSGFAVGLTQLPHSYLHTRVFDAVREFLFPPAHSGTTARKSTFAGILRTTLVAAEPAHIAQGPVWGLCVVSNLLVMVGGGLQLDPKVAHIFAVFINCARRHPKSAIRALACISCRCLTWTFFQPTPIEEDGSLRQSEDESSDIAELGIQVLQEVELGSGVSTIAALLGDNQVEDDGFKMALQIMMRMVEQGGHPYSDALDILKQLVSLDPDTPQWHLQRMLAPGLFDTMPGLLTTDFNNIALIVRPMVDQCPQPAEIRPLTREELSTDWIVEGLGDVWKSAIPYALVQGGDALVDLKTAWELLVTARVTVIQESGDADGLVGLAEEATGLIADLVCELDFAPVETVPSEEVFSTEACDAPTAPAVPPTPTLNAIRKLCILRQTWLTSRAAIPNCAQSPVVKDLLAALVNLEPKLEEEMDDERKKWALFCAEVLLGCDRDDIEGFWEHEGVLRMRKENFACLWSSCVTGWRAEGGATWEDSVFLLGIPFTGEHPWDFNNEQIEEWDNFLGYTTDLALDGGMDAVALLDHVSETISPKCGTTSVASTRLADVILGRLDLEDARQLPDSLLSFVNDILVSSYPPELENKPVSMWLIRSLTRVMGACPNELLLDMLECLKDGFCTWVTDGQKVMTQEEYSFNVLPLYQTMLAGVQTLSVSTDMFDALCGILEAPLRGHRCNAPAASHAFRGFWKSTFATIPEPVGGWPDQIIACLEPACEAEERSDELDVEASLPEAQAGREQDLPECETGLTSSAPTSPVTVHQDEAAVVIKELGWDKDSKAPFSFKGVGPAFVRTLLKALERRVPIAFQPQSSEQPSTPISERNATTPARPRKTPIFRGTHKLVNRSPPASPLDARRGRPATPGSVSGHVAVGNKTGSKENLSLLPRIESIVERIAKEDCTDLTMLSAGKRKILGDGQIEPEVKKRRLGIALPPGESDDERNTQETLVYKAAPPPDIGLFTTPVRQTKDLPRKRRQGVFLDAVEVPSLSLLKRRDSRSRELQATTSKSPVILSSKRSHSCDTGDFPATPIRPFQRARIDRSASELILSPYEAPAEGSSDDDPHLGQVTPHHLISPPASSGKTLDSDPPSDDSVTSASPSRAASARRRRLPKGTRAPIRRGPF